MSAQSMQSLNSFTEWILSGIRDNLCHSIKVNILSEEFIRTEFEDKGQKYTKPVCDQMKSTEEYKRLDFIYPYTQASNLPSKLTVTGLNQYSDSEAEKASWTRESYKDIRAFTVPVFQTKARNITGAERGVLLHHVMQYIDYNIGSDELSISAELERMIRDNYLTKEQMLEIDIKKIALFMESDLCSRIKSSENFYREFKFSLLRPVEAYYTDGGKDEILLQGVIDCFFEEDDELVIVDFKSDKMTKSMINEKAQRYATQLSTYADAIERITGKKAKESIIYFFDIDTEHKIQSEERQMGSL